MMSSEFGRCVWGGRVRGHLTEVRLCSKTGVYACTKVRERLCPQTFAASCLRAGAVTVTSLPPPQGPLKSLRLRIWLF